MSSSKQSGAYADNSNDYRRKWDKEEYAAKAKAQDTAAYEHAQEVEKALAAGKKPPKPPRSGVMLPKPTKSLEARKEDLEIEKNLGKSMLVSGTGKGPGAGFYVSFSHSFLYSMAGALGRSVIDQVTWVIHQCEMCRRTLKDSIAYLDHVNGRSRECALLPMTSSIQTTDDTTTLQTPRSCSSRPNDSSETVDSPTSPRPHCCSSRANGCRRNVEKL